MWKKLQLFRICFPKWEKHSELWTNQRKTEKDCNILHIYESWHVHDSCHIVFGLSKPCQDILINHHEGGSPCPAPSEWVEVKKPGMEEPVGEMEVGDTKVSWVHHFNFSLRKPSSSLKFLIFTVLFSGCLQIMSSWFTPPCCSGICCSYTSNI